MLRTASCSGWSGVASAASMSARSRASIVGLGAAPESEVCQNASYASHSLRSSAVIDAFEGSAVDVVVVGAALESCDDFEQAATQIAAITKRRSSRRTVGNLGARGVDLGARQTNF